MMCIKLMLRRLVWLGVIPTILILLIISYLIEKLFESCSSGDNWSATEEIFEGWMSLLYLPEALDK